MADRTPSLQELPGTYAALDHRFTVATDFPRVGTWLETVLGALTSAEPPAGRYVLRGAGPARLEFDDELVAEGTWAFVLGMLLWHCNREAVARSPGLVRLHAAAACRDDAAVLLPATMEAGKTTLVAGLVQAGLGYLSDEIAALEPTSLRMRAYPKPLSIDPGSWEVLASLRPDDDEDLEGLLPHQWIVAPTAIAGGAAYAGAEPRLLVAPRYEAGARTVLEPLGRVDALLHVASTTFDLGAAPERDLDVLARLVQGCPAYRLVVGDLEEACALVLDALEQTTEVVRR